MFDNVVVFRNSSQQLISLGLLAETMLFYREVHLLLNRSTFSSLLRNLGGDGFDRLLKRPGIRMSYEKENFGTFGITTSGLRALNFTIFEVGNKGKRLHSNRSELAELVERELGKSRGARRQADKWASSIAFPRVADDLPPDQLMEDARRDLDDAQYVAATVAATLGTLVPSFVLPKNWHFRIFKLGDGSFAVDTNLDMQSINREYHKSVPPQHSSITVDYLVGFVLETFLGAYRASRYSAEFVHEPLHSELMKIRYLNLLRRRERSLEEIDLFQNLHLDGRSIAAAIDAKERTFDDFLELLDNSHKFRSWLHGVNPDRKLLSEYFDAVTRETWIDKLPTKGMRWVVTTGLAAIVESFYPSGMALMLSQGVSLADATVLDRILKGWKPNQFVTGSLAEFVGIDP